VKKAGPLKPLVPCFIAGLSLALVLLSCGGEKQAEDKAGDLAKRLERLRSLPYSAVTDQEVNPDSSGVVVYDSARAYRGYNIVCERLKVGAYLMDMNGNVVHRWSYPEDQSKYWIHAILLNNGDLLVVHKMRGILRLDWNSNLIWKQKMLVHHDVAVAPDSSLYAFALGIRKHRGFIVRFASIVHLWPDGERRSRWATYQHLDQLKQALDQRSFLDTILDSMLAEGSMPDTLEPISGRLEVRRHGGRDDDVLDYFHANTLSIIKDNALGRKDDRFKAGRLLTCFRNVNQIAVMDLDTMEILWSWGEGELEWPHHPTMLDNGHILIFDNGVVREYTRVLEMDPLTGEIVWQYDGGPDHRFYSPTRGSAQRFPNGNTLICDADNGRAFEVTPEGEIVWEWLNPTMDEGHRERLYRMLRYPPEIVEPLISRLGANGGEVAAGR
jgi:hypothetical protein